MKDGSISAGMLKYKHKARSTFDAGFQVSLKMIQRLDELVRKEACAPPLNREPKVAKKEEKKENADDQQEGSENEADTRDEARWDFKPDVEFEIVFKGFGHGKQAFFAAMMSSEGRQVRSLVWKFQDRTPLKMGGTRSKKARRL